MLGAEHDDRLAAPLFRVSHLQHHAEELHRSVLAVRLTNSFGDDEIRIAEKIGDEARSRRLVDVRRRADLDDAARLHDGEAIRHRRRGFLIVRDIDRREAQALLNGAQLDRHVVAEPPVERRHRLVEQDDRRLGHERARQGDPLQLPPAQRVRMSLGEFLRRQLNQRKHPLDLLDDRRAREALHPQAEGDVLANGHVREDRERLEHKADIAPVRRNPQDASAQDADIAGAWTIESGDHPHGGRLPAARRAEQRQNLAREDLQRDVVDGANCAVRKDAGDFHQFDDGGGARRRHGFARCRLSGNIQSRFLTRAGATAPAQFVSDQATASV